MHRPPAARRSYSWSPVRRTGHRRSGSGCNRLPRPDRPPEGLPWHRILLRTDRSSRTRSARNRIGCALLSLQTSGKLRIRWNDRPLRRLTGKPLGTLHRLRHPGTRSNRRAGSDHYGSRRRRPDRLCRTGRRHHRRSRLRRSRNQRHSRSRRGWRRLSRCGRPSKIGRQRLAWSGKDLPGTRRGRYRTDRNRRPDRRRRSSGRVLPSRSGRGRKRRIRRQGGVDRAPRR